MIRLRGIVAIFILLFLLSTVSLLMLVADDQKDLSSRASINEISSTAKPLESYQAANKDFVYDPNLWLKLESNLFLNQKNNDTLRIYSFSFNSASVSAAIGKEFTNRKLLGFNQTALAGWVAEMYSYQLFGETKKVNLWTNGKYSVLEVGLIKNLQTDTIDFLKSLEEQSLVLGSSTPDDSAKLATLTRPSVAMVLNHYCAELKFFSAPDFPLSSKVYPFCLTSVGSGFFVSSNGLLATNGHIVKNLPKSSLFYGISGGKLDTLLSDFLNVYFSQINKRIYTEEEIKQKVKEAHANKEVLYQVGGLIADLNQKNILKFQNEKNTYFLQVGNKSAELTENGVREEAGVVGATLVDIDYQEPNEEGFISSDVALLKAKDGLFPALALGEIEETLVGSNLQVIGFPAAAMSAGTLLDSTSVSEPTFTKGVVSAIKSARGDLKKLIQTDAIINHGNSGGPAILQNGKVIGIATYGVSTEDGFGSYNFLRDVQDVKDLVSKNNLNLEQGEIFNLWQEGLKNYWLGYFKYSSEKFQRLKELYPVHPMVEKYLSASDSKIGTVEDLTPKFTHEQRSVLIYLSGAIMAISFICIIAFLLLIRHQNKNINNFPSAPTF